MKFPLLVMHFRPKTPLPLFQLASHFQLQLLEPPVKLETQLKQRRERGGGGGGRGDSISVLTVFDTKVLKVR